MKPSCNYFLSERIALAACKAINRNPEAPLEKENLVKLQHGNISKENAQKKYKHTQKARHPGRNGPTNRLREKLGE